MAANGGGTIPASPAMMAAQPNTREWIAAWVASFGGDIEAHAADYVTKLVEAGYVGKQG